MDVFDDKTMEEKMKYIGFISVVITIIGMLVAGATSYAKLEAKVERSQDYVKSMEVKVVELDKANNNVEKSLVAIQTEQQFIKQGIQEANENIKVLIGKIKN